MDERHDSTPSFERTQCRPASSATNSASTSTPFVEVRSRGRLPHWEQENAVYFVTFRLADSLPEHVLTQIRDDVEMLKRKRKAVDKTFTETDEQELARLTNERIEQYLDSGTGAGHLRQPRVADIVRDALRHFDGNRYTLHAWCIMPNHVHLVLALAESERLDKVLHSIKSFTANRANKLLGRNGAFWQREYYDRIVRDRDEYSWVIEYVLNNPGAAGLVGWAYVERGSADFESA